MYNFNQFDIKIAPKGFEGDKIKMAKIKNRQIVVHDFKIEDSKCFKEKGSGKCLHLQISINGEKYINFTSSSYLIDAIQQIPKDCFPFATTIIEDNERYLFT